MRNSITYRSLAVATVMVAVAALTSCAGAPAASTSKEGGGGADAAAATRFVTCLEEEGQRAKLLDGGLVGVLMPEGSTPGEGMTFTGDDTSGSFGYASDEEGTWLAAPTAAAYPEEGGRREAWATCEGTVPEFSQPEPKTPGGEGLDFDLDAIKAQSLEFATCARDNGFDDFADPDADGFLSLPNGISEDEARTLIEACTDPEENPFPPLFDPDSTEGLDFDLSAVIAEFFPNAIVTTENVPTEGGE